MKKFIYEEDDLFDLTEEEFCKKYDCSSEDYQLLHKQIQEM